MFKCALQFSTETEEEIKQFWVLSTVAPFLPKLITITIITSNKPQQCVKLYNHPAILFHTFRFRVIIPYLDYVYTRANVSGFVTDPEHFSPGFVLLFTHKTWIWNQNFPVLSRIWKLLNPELKVETLYLDTLRIRIPWMWWIQKHSWIREPLLWCKRSLRDSLFG